MQSFLLLLPDFALIALGVALRRFAGLGDGFWPGVERLVYFVLFPALLFLALARARIDFAGDGQSHTHHTTFRCAVSSLANLTVVCGN